MCPASLRVPGGSHGVTAGAEGMNTCRSPCSPAPSARTPRRGRCALEQLDAVTLGLYITQIAACSSLAAVRAAVAAALRWCRRGLRGGELRVTQGPAGPWGWGMRGAVVMLGWPQVQILAGDGVLGGCASPLVWHQLLLRVVQGGCSDTRRSQPGLSPCLLLPGLSQGECAGAWCIPCPRQQCFQPALPSWHPA